MTSEQKLESNLKRIAEEIKEMELPAFEHGDRQTGSRLGTLRGEFIRLANGLPARAEAIGHVVGVTTLEGLK